MNIKISSFFVCVVSQDDMIRSDLGSYLKEMRASRASVPLKTIKKYLAHIIEGVHFMHTILKRVHRYCIRKFLAFLVYIDLC